MPPAGGLSNVFGRQPVMLASIFLFALGSALAGAAQSMNMLIAARGECAASSAVSFVSRSTLLGVRVCFTCLRVTSGILY